METLQSEYIELSKSKDALFTAFLQLKDYNTELRLTILNIPELVTKSDKKNTKFELTLKKLKSLAKRGEESVSLAAEKKRKAETEPLESPQPKRAYKKRGRPSRQEKQAQIDILNESNEEEAAEEEGENSLLEEIDINIIQPSLNKTILTDTFQ